MNSVTPSPGSPSTLGRVSEAPERSPDGVGGSEEPRPSHLPAGGLQPGRVRVETEHQQQEPEHLYNSVSMLIPVW